MKRASPPLSRMIVAILLVSVFVLFSSSYKLDSSSTLRAKKLGDKIIGLSQKGGIFIIDGDNVRGKTKFSISKEDLIIDVTHFQQLYNLTKRVVLHYDHALEHEAHVTNQFLSIVFSGPKTSDDIIARDVSWLQSRVQQPVVVITADNGLASRCHQANRAADRLTIIDSVLFAELLGTIVTEQRDYKEANLDMKPIEPKLLESTEEALKELQLRNQIRSMNKISKSKKGGRKSRVKLRKQLTDTEAKLRTMLEDSAESSTGLQYHENRINDLNAALTMLRVGASLPGKELTWERCILAERLRSQLLMNTIARLRARNNQSNYSEVQISSSADFNLENIDRIDAPVSLANHSDSASDAAIVRGDYVSVHEDIISIYVEELNANYSKTNFSELVLLAEYGARAASTAEPHAVESSSSSPGDSSTLSLVPAVFPVSLSTELPINQFDKASMSPSELLSTATSSSLTASQSVPAPVESPPEHATVAPITLSLLTIEPVLSSPVQPAPVPATIDYFNEYSRNLAEKLTPFLKVPEPGSSGSTRDGVPYTIDSQGCRVYRVPMISTCTDQLSDFNIVDMNVAAVSSDRHGGVIGSSAESSDDSSNDGVPLPNIVCDEDFRIVCVSDTHGMEPVLSGRIPDGDILVHAGDYAPDRGSSFAKVKALDKWLASLPHRVKIVVRGNHDPLTAAFPLSGAIFAASATTVRLTREERGRGLCISLAPHKTTKVLPGHVLISHEPPHSIGSLDVTYKKGMRAGSEALTVSASVVLQKPAVWICGHIHEGHGACEHLFSVNSLSKSTKTVFKSYIKDSRKQKQQMFELLSASTQENAVAATAEENDVVISEDGSGRGTTSGRCKTLVVNAANANSGAARYLVNLPTVITIDKLYRQQ